MYKQFLETVLPSQGNYCIFTIAADVKKQKTIEGADLEKTYELIEDYKAKPPTNIYFALSSFDGFTRKADESIYIKSFFLDLDVYLHRLRLSCQAMSHNLRAANTETYVLIS